MAIIVTISGSLARRCMATSVRNYRRNLQGQNSEFDSIHHGASDVASVMARTYRSHSRRSWQRSAARGWTSYPCKRLRRRRQSGTQPGQTHLSVRIGSPPRSSMARYLTSPPHDMHVQSIPDPWCPLASARDAMQDGRQMTPAPVTRLLARAQRGSTEEPFSRTYHMLACCASLSLTLVAIGICR